MIPAEYKQWLDHETIDFIERTIAFYPTDTISASIARQRQIYDAMCREFSAELPDKVVWKDKAISNTDGVDISIRCYSRLQDKPISRAGSNSSAGGNEQRETVIIYLHGGGFVVGGLESHHDVCAELCEQTGCDLISVDYRLSPEHAHPAALDDVMTVVRHVYQSSKSIILCGDSAGGNLAACASAKCRDAEDLSQAIIAQVLIYPGLGGECLPEVVEEIKQHESGMRPDSASSYITHADAPMLTLEEVLFYREVRLPVDGVQNPAVCQSSLAPLLAERFDGLPPTVCFGAQCDPLHDDGQWYCSAISAIGGKAHFISETGMVHGYLRARNSVERARASFKRIINAISAFQASS